MIDDQLQPKLAEKESKYWLRYSDGGKKANRTMAKLDQIDFTWNSVLD